MVEKKTVDARGLFCPGPLQIWKGVIRKIEAGKYLNKKGCRVKLLATSKAIHAWNTAGEKVIGLFHVTC